MTTATNNTVTSGADNIDVRPLHPMLGAEINGVDLSKPLSETVFAAIHDAWMKHLVLVFPKQAISDPQHIAVSKCFGDLEVHHQDIIRSKFAPEIFRVSNVDEDDQIIPAHHSTARQIAQAQRWHTDSSFRLMPSVGSMLHGVETSTSGGETWFCNLYAVYEALPQSLRAKVDGRRAQHNFEYLHIAGGLRELTAKERAAMPPIMQPLVRIHPVTGRKSLYISPIYNDHIEGLDAPACETLLEELIDFAEQEQFVYKHRWSPHDIVLWDNRCTMHRVTPYDPNERRVMHRTTIAGTEAVRPG